MAETKLVGLVVDPNTVKDFPEDLLLALFEAVREKRDHAAAQALETETLLELLRKEAERRGLDMAPFTDRLGQSVIDLAKQTATDIVKRYGG